MEARIILMVTKSQINLVEIQAQWVTVRGRIDKRLEMHNLKVGLKY